MKTYYYLYKITNLVNAKIYVGVHRTQNLDDGYMGSGKVINRAIENHGIGNFRKDILEFFDTAEAMYAREKEVVTDEFLLREDTYNLRRGGNGGFDFINTNKLNYHGLQTMSKEQLLELTRRNGLKTGSANLIKAHKEGKIKYDNFKNKNHTTETKEKMSIAKKGKGRSHHNSQFGTMWITNGTENKKIKNDAIIPTGWTEGRKLKSG